MMANPASRVITCPCNAMADDDDGTEWIKWLPVVEEVRSNPADPSSGPFSLVSTGPQRGLVALRINCPYQASTMTAFRQEPAPGSGELVNVPVLAHDAVHTDPSSAPAPGQLLATGTPKIGVFAGQYGLGKFYAMGAEGAQGVRPFRRLISAQSMFRREVYSQ